MSRGFSKMKILLGANLYPFRLLRKLSLLCSKVFSLSIFSRLNAFGSNNFFHHSISTQGEQYISIGSGTSFGARGILSAWDNYKGTKFTPRIQIGDRVWIGEDFHISSINEILIGNNVLMGKQVSIIDNSHGHVSRELMDIPPMDRPLYSKGPIHIEDNVWIGDKVTVLPGITIGKGSIIGANAVVTKSIPPFCVAAGNPARIIKTLS